MHFIYLQSEERRVLKMHSVATTLKTTQNKHYTKIKALWFLDFQMDHLWLFLDFCPVRTRQNYVKLE